MKYALVVLAALSIACEPGTIDQTFLGEVGTGQSDVGTDGTPDNDTADMKKMDVTQDATSDVSADTGLDTTPDADAGPRSVLSFFVTSTGSGDDGGNLNGLLGADAKCLQLATAVGADDRTWAAYLSTDALNARDRIGAGPWFNQAETMVGADLTTLHANGIPEADVIDENGTAAPSAQHDIMTGSDEMGNLTGMNCLNWTSNSNAEQNTVGHSDYESTRGAWNSIHASPCDAAGIAGNAGGGRIYCFATD